MARSMMGLLLLFVGCGAPSATGGLQKPSTVEVSSETGPSLEKIKEARDKIEEELLLNLLFHVMYQKEMLVNKAQDATPIQAAACREVIVELDGQTQDILNSLGIPERLPD